MPKALALITILVAIHAASASGFRKIGPARTTRASASIPANVMDSEITNFDFAAVREELARMPPSPDRDYFAGILANRTGKISESIRLLEKAIPRIRASQPARTAIALQTLSDNFMKTYQYGDAARTYDDLLDHFASVLSAADRQGANDDSGVAHLLESAPPQTISWNGPLRLKTGRTPISVSETKLTVNGVTQEWLLDTGANMSVVSSSFAQRLRLQPLPGYGQTMGSTGKENRLHVAVLPTIQIGGATLHDVVILILDDSSLNVGLGTRRFQINAIIGYPVLEALGAITFSGDGFFEGGSSQLLGGIGTPMFMDGLMPVVECRVNGDRLVFDFDTGASTSTFFERYYAQFHVRANDWKEAVNESYGAGGLVRRKVYLIPKVDLRVGGRTATLRRITVFPGPTGSGGDDVYGNLGSDVVVGFKSFTLDFENMKFSLGDPVQ
jgi:hypothetical protein